MVDNSLTIRYNHAMTTTFLETLSRATDTIIAGGMFTEDEALRFASVPGEDLVDLFAAAARIRRYYRGNAVDICSIVNAKSGACSEDCSYCAQSIHHATNAPVYPLISVDRMSEAAESAGKNGARRFCIVTSGRGIGSRDDLKNIAKGIKRVRKIGLAPCATLGTLTREQLTYLKDAGLERYHHNIETSRDYFPRICTTHTFDDRIEVLHNARSLGLSVCSGGILGMGENMEDRIKMAFSLRELEVDSVPINFLMPIMGTPLERVTAITPLEALHSIALFRLILPKKEIRICAGRGTALGQLHPLIFLAGADGFMIGNYLTTSGLNPADDLKMIQDLGLRT
ncbi:MAG TPA: biotin synthase BioB [Nitrospirota bacterium]|nr:biotin synthase BioB [Nitrospirota bacterium]